jgi:hypothetical protein
MIPPEALRKELTLGPQCSVSPNCFLKRPTPTPPPLCK